MDSDDDQKNKITKRKKQKTGVIQRYISNVSDVLSPIWVRRIIQINDGFEWFVLGCRYNFLLYFRVFLVVLYITYETLK